MKNSKTIALCGVSLALSLILSLVENMLPPLLPALPYAKLGLSNVVIMLLFVVSNAKYAYPVLILKCVLSALFAGAPTMMLYSLPAGLVSFTVVMLLLKSKNTGIVAVSAAGAIVHNTVQVFVGMIIAGAAVISLLPYMMLAGGAAGIVTGFIVFFAVKYMPASTLESLAK